MPAKKRAASSNEISSLKKGKMHQTTLFNNGPSIDNNCWVVSESLLIYNHPNIKPSSKILSFDMDGTLISTASGKVFAKDINDWKILNDKVVPKLQYYHNQGFKIVIMSNQSGVSKGHVTVSDLQIKVQNIIKKLAVPVQGFFSLLSDRNRKPVTGMWETMEQTYNGGVSVDRSRSIYCGDAAGRPAEKGRKKDFSCSDRLFALNLGVQFMTPEQLFSDEPSSNNFTMPVFDPRLLKSQTPPEYPFLQKPKGIQMILMDILGTAERCLKEAKTNLAAGTPVVIDNTNVDVESRSRFIKLAKEMDCPVQCMVMKTTFEQSLHNERFRSLTNPTHQPIGTMVYNMMKSKYKRPELSEGLGAILDIPFVLDPKIKDVSLYCSFLVDK